MPGNSPPPCASGHAAKQAAGDPFSNGARTGRRSCESAQMQCAQCGAHMNWPLNLVGCSVASRPHLTRRFAAGTASAIHTMSIRGYGESSCCLCSTGIYLSCAFAGR